VGQIDEVVKPSLSFNQKSKRRYTMEINKLTVLAGLFIATASVANDSTLHKSDTASIEFLDVTKDFSVQDFEAVKSFMLEKGDRQTYCQMYSDNPCYSFNGFIAYLNPEIGQRNGRCDPAISDFNEIVIRDLNAQPQYYMIRIVRKGDLNDSLIYVFDGMSEERVYLLKYYDGDLNAMENSLKVYIEAMKKAVSSKTISFFKPKSENTFCIVIGQRIMVKLSASSTGPMTAALYSVSGKKIAQQNGPKEVSFDVSNIAKGTYFVSVKTGKANLTGRVAAIYRWASNFSEVR
jgi:hypothetical protein